MFERNKPVITSGDMTDMIFRKCDIVTTNRSAEIYVEPNTEAIVFIDNALEYVLKPGKHLIGSDKKVKNQKLDICFVSKGARLNCLWGTPAKIDYIDYKTKIPAALGASGSLTVEIENSLKLFQRVIASRKEYSLQDLNKYIKTEASVNAKNILANILIDSKADIFELADDLEKLSDTIAVRLRDEWESYGIRLVAFRIENLALDETVKKLMQKVAMKNYEENFNAALAEKTNIKESSGSKAEDTAISSTQKAEIITEKTEASGTAKERISDNGNKIHITEV